MWEPVQKESKQGSTSNSTFSDLNESQHVESAREKNAGNTAYKSGDLRRALQHYTKAIELTPSDHILYSNRSMALGSLGMWQESEQAAAKAVELSPGFIKGHFRLVKAQLEQGELAQALVSSDRGMQADRDENGGELSARGKELQRLSGAAAAKLVSMRSRKGGMGDGTSGGDGDEGDGGREGADPVMRVGEGSVKGGYEGRGGSGGGQGLSMLWKPSLKDFKVVQELGTGNFSSIVKVEHRRNGHVYALKAIEKATVNRLKRRHANIYNEIYMEKRALLRLQHPGVVKLHSTFQDYGSLYYLVELCEGGEVWQRLVVGGKVVGTHPSLARAWLAEVLSALEHMHSRGLVHRDLKPENMMVTKDGHIKLIDFGTCKDLVDVSLNGDEFVGTAQYMSPQAVASEEQGREADLWALGCCAYQFFAGFTPFHAPSPYLCFLRIKKGIFRCPLLLPEDVVDFIIRLLRRDPSKRLGAGGGEKQCPSPNPVEGCNADSPPPPSPTPMQKTPSTALHSSSNKPGCSPKLLASELDLSLDSDFSPVSGSVVKPGAGPGLVPDPSLDLNKQPPIPPSVGNSTEEGLGSTQGGGGGGVAKDGVAVAGWRASNSGCGGFAELKVHPFFKGQVFIEDGTKQLPPAVTVAKLSELCIRALADHVVAYASTTTLIRDPLPPHVDLGRLRVLGGELCRAVEAVKHYLGRRGILQQPKVHRLFHSSATDAKSLRADAVMRDYLGLDWDSHGQWDKPFFFIQAADPQFGMVKANGPTGGEVWETEVERLTKLVSIVNRLRPRFLVVSGDMTHALPGEEFYEKQVSAIRKVMVKVSETIPVLYCPGNHDVGPSSPESGMQQCSVPYVKRFGADFYGFWWGGVRGLVLNTNLWANPLADKTQREEQDHWLDQELEVAQLNAHHLMVFGHHPWFLKDPFEDSDPVWTPIPRETRLKWIGKMGHCKVRYIFSGHCHRNYTARTGRVSVKGDTHAMGLLSDKVAGDNAKTAAAAAAAAAKVVSDGSAVTSGMLGEDAGTGTKIAGTGTGTEGLVTPSTSESSRDSAVTRSESDGCKNGHGNSCKISGRVVKEEEEEEEDKASDEPGTVSGDEDEWVEEVDMHTVVTSSCTAPLGPDPPGFRLIRVYNRRIEHQYYTLEAPPERVELEPDDD